MEKGIKFVLKDVVQMQNKGIVSSQILENKAGGVMVFAFDKDQRLSEHRAPFDAIVNVIEGEGEIVIDGISHKLKAGESIIMPADIPHAVNAHEAFKMMLIMIKG